MIRTDFAFITFELNLTSGKVAGILQSVLRFRATGLALALASSFIYLGNWRTVPSGDTIPASLLPIVLSTEGKTDFGEFKDHYEHRGVVWFFTGTKHGYVSSYPITAGLLAVPIYALPVLWIQHFQHPVAVQWLPFASVMEKVSATVFTAGSVWIFFELAITLGAGLSFSLLSTISYAFGTEAWSTSSQALWMHGPSALFILATALAVAKVILDPHWRLAAVAGLCAGICVAVRLNNLLIVGPLLILLLLRNLRCFVAALVPLALLVAAQMAYNIVYFGRPAGQYSLSFKEPSLQGLAGLLFSPGRGLFFYFPVAIFAVHGLAHAVRTRSTWLKFYGALAFSVIALLLLVAKWNEWYGGGSFGPRLLAETQPLLLLLMIPLGPGFFAEFKLRNAFFVLAVIWSIGAQGLGAWRQSDWNAQPRNINDSPERLWDWDDNPLARALKNSSETAYWPRPSAEWLLPATRLLDVELRDPDHRLAIQMVSGWYPPESSRQNWTVHVWDWGQVDPTLHLENFGLKPVKVRFSADIRSNVPKKVTLSMDQKEVWRGETSSSGTSFTTDEIILENGVHQTIFRSPAVVAKQDPRELSIRLDHFKVSQEN